jgi:hypothetical protein
MATLATSTAMPENRPNHRARPLGGWGPNSSLAAAGWALSRTWSGRAGVAAGPRAVLARVDRRRDGGGGLEPLPGGAAVDVQVELLAVQRRRRVAGGAAGPAEGSPGWIATKMGGAGGGSLAEGADTPL